MIIAVRNSCLKSLKSIAVSTQAEESILLKTASYTFTTDAFHESITKICDGLGWLQGDAGNLPRTKSLVTNNTERLEMCARM